MSSQPIGRKPGRPTEHDLDLYRGLFPEWSERTLARYARAMRLLRQLGYSVGESRTVLRLATRPNGTIRVSRLEQLAEARVYLAVERADSAEVRAS